MRGLNRREGSGRACGYIHSGQFHNDVPLDLAHRFPGQVTLLTIQDYLDICPPARPVEQTQPDGTRRYQGGDVVHIEDGAWWGANLGDPEYSEWVDDPAMRGFSPKNNSCAVLTAAKEGLPTLPTARVLAPLRHRGRKQIL